MIKNQYKTVKKMDDLIADINLIDAYLSRGEQITQEIKIIGKYFKKHLIPLNYIHVSQALDKSRQYVTFRYSTYDSLFELEKIKVMDAIIKKTIHKFYPSGIAKSHNLKKFISEIKSFTYYSIEFLKPSYSSQFIAYMNEHYDTEFEDNKVSSNVKIKQAMEQLKNIHTQNMSISEIKEFIFSHYGIEIHRNNLYSTLNRYDIEYKSIKKDS